MYATTAADREDLGVVVAAQSVGPALHQAVHDLHAGTPRGRQQTFDVRQRLAARLLREYGKSGVRADDGALAFLCDDRGVFRRGEFGEVDSHTEAGTSPGGVAGMS